MNSALVYHKGPLSFTSYASTAQKQAIAGLQSGVEASLLFIQEKAMEYLLEFIYDADRAPFAPEFTEELLHSWRHDIKRVSYGVAASITNTSSHGGFVEFGTEQHLIVAKKAAILGKRKKRSGAAMLRWIDPQTGEVVYAPWVVVSGIPAVHYLLRAVANHEGEIAAIIADHIRAAMK